MLIRIEFPEYKIEEVSNIERIKDTVYRGALDRLPKALFNMLANLNPKLSLKMFKQDMILNAFYT